jgi:hypothetical protein
VGYRFAPELVMLEESAELAADPVVAVAPAAAVADPAPVEEPAPAIAPATEDARVPVRKPVRAFA